LFVLFSNVERSFCCCFAALFTILQKAGASPHHQQEILSADFSDTFRTLFYTGRPLRVKKKPFVVEWEGVICLFGLEFCFVLFCFFFLFPGERRPEMQRLLNNGKIPYNVFEEELREKGFFFFYI
jgi:hypothetical protein